MSGHDHPGRDAPPSAGFVKSRAGGVVVAVFALLLSAIPILLVSHRSMADGHSGYLVDHGIAVYYAVVPAEMIRGHSKQHPEATMHGGVPDGPHVHHVMVALFDASSFGRIVNAEVMATVEEVGLAGQQKQLEPFTVADALTYGNYFDMRPRTDYQIRVGIKLPGSQKSAEVLFGFRHE